jgi:internalin A
MVYRHPDPQIEVTYMIDHDMKKIMILHVVAPRFKVSKPLFISYSHNDEVWMKELKKWLKPLEQSDLIDVWDDTRIQPGQDWREEIQKALDDARLAILLVSQDFLTSEFISNDELPKLLDSAKNKGVEILWIAVSSCTVDDTPIARYQAVHKEPPLDLLSDPEKKEKLLRIYEKIKSVVNN